MRRGGFLAAVAPSLPHYVGLRLLNYHPWFYPMWLTSDSVELEAIEELEKASDRSVAVIAGAIIDSQLTDAILTDLHRDNTAYSRKVRHEVFNADGPLGNFG